MNNDVTVPQPTSQEEAEFLRYHMKEMREVVTAIAYVVGGRDATNGAFYVYGQPAFNTLQIRWTAAYSCIDLIVERNTGEKVFDTRVFGRNDSAKHRNGFVVAVASYTNELLALFLPGIKVESSYQQCSIPIHLNKWMPPGRRVDLEPRITVCRNQDGRWVCYDCQELYNLPPSRIETAANQKARSHAERERAKMSSSLRFTVLEAGNFECAICGRSPMKGDNVKLHIDHKMPISKGGMTELENLWILCDGCNLGKSNKVVEQLVLRFEQVAQ